MKVYFQVFINVKVENGKKDFYLKDFVILEVIKKVEEKLNGKGRVLIRLFGIEFFVRVMIEGEDYEEIKKDVSYIVSLIELRFF